MTPYGIYALPFSSTAEKYENLTDQDIIDSNICPEDLIEFAVVNFHTETIIINKKIYDLSAMLAAMSLIKNELVNYRHAAVKNFSPKTK